MLYIKLSKKIHSWKKWNEAKVWNKHIISTAVIRMVLWSVSSFGILCSIEWNCHFMLYKISKQCRSHWHKSGSLKSHRKVLLHLNKKSVMSIRHKVQNILIVQTHHWSEFWHFPLPVNSKKLIVTILYFTPPFGGGGGGGCITNGFGADVMKLTVIFHNFVNMPNK